MNMKKSTVWCEIGYIAVGILMTFFSIMSEGKIGSLLAGFAGGSFGVGIIMLSKYFYWNRPNHLEQYKKKLEEEEIELMDERNERYRDKAGRFAYKVSMIMIPISIIIFSILDAAEVYSALVINVYLVVLWIILYVVGVAAYRKFKIEE